MRKNLRWSDLAIRCTPHGVTLDNRPDPGAGSVHVYHRGYAVRGHDGLLFAEPRTGRDLVLAVRSVANHENADRARGRCRTTGLPR